MGKRSEQNPITWLILVALVGILFEISFNTESLVFLGVSALLIYFGKKKSTKSSGAIYIIVGISIFVITIITTVFFKIVLFCVLIYLLFRYRKKKKHPKIIKVETVESTNQSKINRKQPYIKNKFFGNQRIENNIYEWDDINIQCGLGTTVIDLSMTMLPIGESTVVIRGVIGNIQLLTPYDVAISVNHSSITGNVNIYGLEENLFNQNTIYYSDNYDESTRKIKIITSLPFGNLEVRHV
ncbi:cell wall-active antibiotics response protein LiaF [Heyndrickxia oleronia]|jgi:lia operon protein LiaF|uniref:Cell wall-active antibiotics response protein LiaF n=1 Tax=Heyndrickxia oleronia TaxID=38875 RepID=A0AAW6SVP9_9BACI|nr:cell wall-active antibiotics response protein LiaF [Heyndrickxia oleronia]MCI1589481.1 cell wall-active antibiotics response protein LiaF [Heyndrickxia oleronia]MCI1611465.1 cell wall-active antibiotics response protein LiaF [Heyndrickxia oleronia]MCI1742907.1 cell wall-active antibiotics response protein LiaF [Heyndrickxia oleronia]MCI1759986.1 cell wall-active antibiotics response protein LiaF [Heyndrickxia oleronia]MCM3237891.1 cell wall-active antibiotics response protein LiaF [Heyndric